MTNSCQWDRTPKARKDHKCDECGRTIAKGTVYHRQSGVFDGEPYSWAVHQDCAALYWAVNKEFGGCWYEETVPLADFELADLATYRGHYPHAICRLEFKEQMENRDDA